MRVPNHLHFFFFLLVGIVLATTVPTSARDSRTELFGPSNVGNGDGQYLEGTLILKLKAGIPNSRALLYFGVPELDAVLSKADILSRRPLFPLAPYSGSGLFKREQTDQGFDRIYILTYAAHSNIYRLIEEVVKTGTVEFAEPYYIFDLFYTPNDPQFGDQYALQQIQIEKAWDIARGDSTVAIAVCDAGVEWSHPDLAEMIWKNPGETGRDALDRDKRTNGIDDDGNGMIDDWRGWDLVGDPQSATAWQNRQWTPDNNPAPRQVQVSGYRGYHGTWVSGCATPHTDNGVGLAGPGFGTRILPVKCSADSIGTGSVVAGYEGIRYAADLQAKVINCSFGGSINPSFVQGLQATIDYAYSKGSLVVAASGNDATHNDRTPVFPANLNHVLSVGATSSTDVPAGFSGYGVSVDVWAPGVNIATTQLGGNYVSNGVSGTSFSAPIVSGVAALLMSQRPDWTPDQIAMQLRVTGDKIATGNPLRYRRLNAFRALSLNQELTANDPNNLPGVGLVSYTITGEGNAVLNGAEDQVTVKLRLRNYLAPTKNLVVEAFENEELYTTEAVNVGVMGTLEEKEIEVTAKVDPQGDVIYSEGDLQLILRLRDGDYEDFITVMIPIELPGWRGQFDAVALNGTLQYMGTGIVATSTQSAWAVSNVQVGQSTFIPVFSRNPNGNQWSGLQQINVNGTGLQSALYALTARNNVEAWAGSGPTNGQAIVYHTVNGGGSWTGTSVANITPFVNGLHFWDQNDGILFGDPRNGIWGIGLTTNGGTTWNPLPTPQQALNSTEVGWSSGFAVYGKSAWFGTNLSRIWRSTDRGQSWTAHPTPSENSFGIAFANESDGLASFRTRQGNLGSNAIAWTQDGGVTWTEGTLPFTGAEPQGVAAVPGTNRFFLGTQRGVFQTTDFGNTWDQMAMPLYNFQGLLLSAQADPETGEIGAYGSNVFSQFMVYRELPAPDTSTTSVHSVSAVQSSAAATLHESTPNPTHSHTTVRFDLHQPGLVRLAIYDASGREQLLVRQGRMEPNSYQATFNAAELSSGTYFLILEVDGERVSRNLVVQR